MAVQFDIERSGQTDLVWDQDGHIDSATVTLATFDPKGRPMTAATSGSWRFTRSGT